MMKEVKHIFEDSTRKVGVASGVRKHADAPGARVCSS